jgi:hypothetical protein
VVRLQQFRSGHGGYHLLDCFSTGNSGHMIILSAFMGSYSSSKLTLTSSAGQKKLSTTTVFTGSLEEADPGYRRTGHAQHHKTVLLG